MENHSLIDVCGPKDAPINGGLKLSVASRAPIHNPDEWKDLWRLSPFSIVAGGVQVPGMPGVVSKTVENAWQFLKVWDGEDGWNETEARAAFASDCAIRFPRGRKQVTVAHHWGETGERLGYVEARRRIYLSAYSQMLEMPDRQELLDRLRAYSLEHRVSIWDYDSYALDDVGLRGLKETIRYTDRPFAHAFIVALAVGGELTEFIEEAAGDRPHSDQSI